MKHHHHSHLPHQYKLGTKLSIVSVYCFTLCFPSSSKQLLLLLQRASPFPQVTPAGWGRGGWATSLRGSSPSSRLSHSGSCQSRWPGQGSGTPLGVPRRSRASLGTPCALSASIGQRSQPTCRRWQKVQDRHDRFCALIGGLGDDLLKARQDHCSMFRGKDP